MPTSPRIWPIAATGLALVAVCYGLARFAYGLFVPAFREEFTLSDSLLGTVGAGSYVGYCLGAVASTAIVARFGARTAAMVAGLIAATGMAGVAISPNAWALATGVLAAGVSTGMASPPFAETIARHASPAQHDRAQAVVNAGTGAGIIVSGLVVMVALGSWRTAWLLFTLIALAVSWWVAAVLPRDRRAGGATGEGLAAVVRSRASWRMAAGAALVGAASSVVWIFGRDHVARAGDLGQTGSTLFWVVLGVGELAGILAGDLIARWGLPRVWATGLITLAGSALALGVLAGSPSAAFVAIGLFGAAYVVLTTAVILWATRLHPEHAAAGVAFGFLAIAAGQAFASPIVGIVADHMGATASFVLCAAVGVGAACVTVSRKAAYAA